MGGRKTGRLQAMDRGPPAGRRKGRERPEPSAGHQPAWPLRTRSRCRGTLLLNNCPRTLNGTETLSTWAGHMFRLLLILLIKRQVKTICGEAKADRLGGAVQSGGAKKEEGGKTQRVFWKLPTKHRASADLLVSSSSLPRPFPPLSFLNLFRLQRGTCHR